MPKLLGVDTGGAAVGSMQDLAGLVASVGFLLADNRTIGNASSGATNRANADTRDLFIHLWNNFTNAELPVSGGRGASGLADFNANKTIQLPDTRGRTTAGKDNMGGVAANRITSGNSGITGTTLGAAGGTEVHTLSTPQIPSHTHSVSPFNPVNSVFGGGSSGSEWRADSGNSVTSSGTGGGGAHQNTQPTYIVSKMIAYK